MLDYRTALNFEKLTKDMNPDERIFNFGPRIYSSTANDFLHRKCKEAGIREISVHGLRHTHASILMSEGVTLPSISKRLGHSSMETTQRVYLHLIQELQVKDDGKIMAAMMELM